MTAIKERETWGDKQGKSFFSGAKSRRLDCRSSTTKNPKETPLSAQFALFLSLLQAQTARQSGGRRITKMADMWETSAELLVFCGGGGGDC